MDHKASNLSTNTRDPNLDLLRSLAIVMVVVHHIAGELEIEDLRLKSVLSLGRHGVVLFFVLSGWLIGSLFWREHRQNGRVDLFRFWFRRWTRTVPPYFAALGLAYTAVAISRAEPFDLHYVFFTQNYLTNIPFFGVSWSLCVEEHFYLIFPLLGGVLAMQHIPRCFTILVFFCVLPLLFRLADPWYHVNREGFGYSLTATHLVFEGLALGVLCSYTASHAPKTWQLTKQVAVWMLIPSLVVFASTDFWPRIKITEALLPTVIAICCATCLTATVGKKPILFSQSRLNYIIAITSYSIYLTHFLAIHAAVRFTSHDWPLAARIAVWLFSISVGGGCFWLLVEWPTLKAREALNKKST